MLLHVLQNGYHVLRHEKDGKEEFTGFYIDLINIMAQSLNFRLVCISV